LPRQKCCSGEHRQPCSCEMGNLYRFVEPIVLVSLARLGTAHGYSIAQEAEKLAVTHAGVDVSAVYRTLRRLEQMGFVRSEWATEESGPARRDYTLTTEGLDHLRQWTLVLGEVMKALSKIFNNCQDVIKKG
jgi:PadR family transcriptional regulator PadR